RTLSRARPRAPLLPTVSCCNEWPAHSWKTVAGHLRKLTDWRRRDGRHSADRCGPSPFEYMIRVRENGDAPELNANPPAGPSQVRCGGVWARWRAQQRIRGPAIRPADQSNGKYARREALPTLAPTACRSAALRARY